MKNLKDIIVEKLKINQDTYKLHQITLLTFIRWCATPMEENELKPEDKIADSSILFALRDNDKGYSKTNELRDFFNENKNKLLEKFTEEKESDKCFVIKFSVDGVNFESKVTVSFLEFLDKNRIE